RKEFSGEERMNNRQVGESIEIIGSVIRGKERVIKLSFAALLCGGHLLFEDLPGTGKTTLAIAVARVIGGEFIRIQFTNDLMPSDIVGTEIYRSPQEGFHLRRGPIFTNVLLADEINRATPRAQSALLEAMGEGRVSLGGKTMELPKPFFVIATQNPMDLYGTYALPESQLDRFFMRMELGYPGRHDEAEIIRHDGHYDEARNLMPLMNPSEITGLQARVGEVGVSERIIQYILDIAEASRRQEFFRYGLSTRGSIALKKASQAWAFIEGREYVVPDDVKEVFSPVTYHRLYPAAELKGDEREAYLTHFLQKVQPPL
ncbi:MAG: MoxR family ATPase, partial [Dehalococcoidia bacterium]|nr:MoxR family ATPase [Dehalococcoidia bacterium]